MPSQQALPGDTVKKKCVHMYFTFLFIQGEGTIRQPHYLFIASLEIDGVLKSECGMPCRSVRWIWGALRLRRWRPARRPKRSTPLKSIA